jgi:hypothetical protein
MPVLAFGRAVRDLFRLAALAFGFTLVVRFPAALTFVLALAVFAFDFLRICLAIAPLQPTPASDHMRASQAAPGISALPKGKSAHSVAFRMTPRHVNHTPGGLARASSRPLARSRILGRRGASERARTGWARFHAVECSIGCRARARAFGRRCAGGNQPTVAAADHAYGCTICARASHGHPEARRRRRPREGARVARLRAARSGTVGRHGRQRLRRPSRNATQRSRMGRALLEREDLRGRAALAAGFRRAGKRVFAERQRRRVSVLSMVR